MPEANEDCVWLCHSSDSTTMAPLRWVAPMEQRLTSKPHVPARELVSPGLVCVKESTNDHQGLRTLGPNTRLGGRVFPCAVPHPGFCGRGVGGAGFLRGPEGQRLRKPGFVRPIRGFRTPAGSG